MSFNIQNIVKDLVSHFQNGGKEAVSLAEFCTEYERKEGRHIHLHVKNGGYGDLSEVFVDLKYQFNYNGEVLIPKLQQNAQAEETTQKENVAPIATQSRSTQGAAPMRGRQRVFRSSTHGNSYPKPHSNVSIPGEFVENERDRIQYDGVLKNVKPGTRYRYGNNLYIDFKTWPKVSNFRNFEEVAELIAAQIAFRKQVRQMDAEHAKFKKEQEDAHLNA